MYYDVKEGEYQYLEFHDDGTIEYGHVTGDLEYRTTDVYTETMG